MTTTPLWLVRHVEKELGARFVNAQQLRRGFWRHAWLVNTSDGAVLVQRRSGGEPHMTHLGLPDARQGMTCGVCDWHMEFVGSDFPIRAYCTNCGTLHELWHDGTMTRLGEPKAVLPAEVISDSPPVTAPAKHVDPKPAAKPRTKPAKKAAKVYVDYKGDVDPVLDVEGIGPVFAGRLEKAGIKTTARLCYETPNRIAKVSQAPLKTAKVWQANAELMKVSGIGKQYAEAMARAGIGGIDDLKKMSADEVVAKVNKYLGGLETNVLGNKFTPRRVAGWKEKAAPMRRVRQSIPAE